MRRPHVLAAAALLIASRVFAADAGEADLAQVRDLELRSWVAWQAQDASFFERQLAEDHIEVHGYGITGKAAVLGAIRGKACTVRGYTLGPLKLTPAAPDVVVVTYRAEQDTQCGPAKAPSPVWVTSTYLRRGGLWVNVVYQQTPVQ